MKKVGIGTRVLNFLVDTIIVFILAYIGNKVQNWYGFYYGYRTYNFGWIFSLAVIVYYTPLEAFWGRTVGKKFSFSKVITQQGKKPGLLRALVRSLVRLTIIDLFFLPFTERTLHDMVSGTEVVEI